MRRNPSSARGILFVLCSLFVISGGAGLVLETVLLRQLAWLFGNSATATALAAGRLRGTASRSCGRPACGRDR